MDKNNVEEYRDLKTAFDFFDTDGSGTINIKSNNNVTYRRY